MSIIDVLFLGAGLILVGLLMIFFFATLFAFFGAMNLPEDINDDVPGDGYDNPRR
jgi:hypothetical protein